MGFCLYTGYPLVVMNGFSLLGATDSSYCHILIFDNYMLLYDFSKMSFSQDVTSYGCIVRVGRSLVICYSFKLGKGQRKRSWI